MHRRYGLLLLLTVAIVLAVAYASVRVFQPSGMPFSVNIVNAHTAVIVPIPGIPLPQSLEPGDQVDLVAAPQATRIAISRFTQFDPVGRAYEFVIRRGRAVVTVPITFGAAGYPARHEIGDGRTITILAVRHQCMDDDH